MLITDSRNIKKYYNALIQKDAQFTGTFFVGVKTTGVFCIPTCRARKPKIENVEFFTEVKDVLRHGYRPCKICNPTRNAYQLPEDVSRALNVLNESKVKIGDYQLKQSGLKPEKIRRWFKKHYGVTFQTYQRMLRINTAFRELQNGNKVTGSALESGYESLSGFGYTFKKMIGSSPKNSKNKTIILITRIESPLGPMFACATEEGVCLLEFTDRRMLETEFKDLQIRLNATIINGENEHLIRLKKELAEYFEGRRKDFSVKLIAPGSPFQLSVWSELNRIPYGETRSYHQQAIALNKPNAVRAVASANGHNRIAILIPCHRVIGKNGALTGYAGGLERKKWLLDHEKKNSSHSNE